jgi:hypothetical protein
MVRVRSATAWIVSDGLDLVAVAGRTEVPSTLSLEIRGAVSRTEASVAIIHLSNKCNKKDPQIFLKFLHFPEFVKQNKCKNWNLCARLNNLMHRYEKWPEANVVEQSRSFSCFRTTSV